MWGEKALVLIVSSVNILFIAVRRHNMAATKFEKATKLVKTSDINKAAQIIEKNGLEWLWSKTGRKLPDRRYVVVKNIRYPSKALGHLATQISSGIETSENLGLSYVIGMFKRLDFQEVFGASVKRKNTKANDAQESSYHYALSRPAQQLFRKFLLEKYGNKCAISGCEVASALEAAHISQFSVSKSNAMENGIILRADLHKLFDFGHLAINPDEMKVYFSLECINSYADYSGITIVLPEGGPTPSTFRERWTSFIAEKK